MRRSGPSSARSIRRASSIPARSSTHRRSRRTFATAPGYKTPAPVTLFRLLGLRRAWPEPSTCAAAWAHAARSSKARCVRRTWRRTRKPIRRAAARTCCVSPWRAVSAKRALATTASIDVLDLCLECRACKAECPVGVDMARFKSEFLADYWSRHGVSRHARMLGNARSLAKWGSAFAPRVELGDEQRACRSISARNGSASIGGARCPTFASRTLTARAPRADERSEAILFSDTFTNYYDPEIGMAALDVLRAAGIRAGLADHHCCGRPQISKGLLGEARMLAERNADALSSSTRPPAGRSCSASPAACRPSAKMRRRCFAVTRAKKARTVAAACVLFEEFAESAVRNLRLKARSA